MRIRTAADLVSDGNAVMKAKIAQLHALAKAPTEAAKDVARAVAVEMGKQISEGRGPDGERWRLTQEGNRPLKRAASSLTVKAKGTAILIQLTGRHARHHLGAVRGKIKRQIIPTRRIPDTVSRAIEKVLDDYFREVMGEA